MPAHQESAFDQRGDYCLVLDPRRGPENRYGRAYILHRDTGTLVGEVAGTEQLPRFALNGTVLPPCPRSTGGEIAIVAAQSPAGETLIRFYSLPELGVTLEARIADGNDAAISPSIVGIGDLDGDAYSEVAVGVPYSASDGVVQAGGVRIVSSATGGVVRVLPGAEPYERFGAAIAVSPGATGTRSLAVATSVLQGYSAMLDRVLLYRIADGSELGRWESTSAERDFGRSVAWFDNAPGASAVDSWAIAAPNRDEDKLTASAIYLAAESGLSELLGLSCDGADELGASIAVLRDPSGPRYVVVGAPGWNVSEGRALVIAVGRDAKIPAIRCSLRPSYRFASRMTVMDDADNDSIQDLVIEGDRDAKHGRTAQLHCTRSLETPAWVWTTPNR